MEIYIILFILIAIEYLIILKIKQTDMNDKSIVVGLAFLICLLAILITIAIISIYLIIGIILYIFLAVYIGTFRYKKIKTIKLNYQSTKLKNKYKIVYLADFQLDLNRIDKFNYEQMHRINEIVRKLDYDILLLGGDYVNYAEMIDVFMGEFAKYDIKDKQVYAVMGNHDYVAYERIYTKLEAMNIKMVENENHLHAEDLLILGVEDMWYGKPQLNLEDYQDETYNLLLSHEPDFIEQIPEPFKIDLILSGHYHKGGFNIFYVKMAALVTKYVYGKYQKNGTNLYVTSGLGGGVLRGKIGYYSRFFASPEVVYITLEPTE